MHIDAIGAYNRTLFVLGLLLACSSGGLVVNLEATTTVRPWCESCPHMDLYLGTQRVFTDRSLTKVDEPPEG